MVNYRKSDEHKFRLPVEVDNELVEAGSVNFGAIDKVRTFGTSLKLGNSLGTKGVIRASPSVETS